jgi:hypothetical protein
LVASLALKNPFLLPLIFPYTIKGDAQFEGWCFGLSTLLITLN